SHANTAQWQYVLPAKSKARVVEVFAAFDDHVRQFYEDMLVSQKVLGPAATLMRGDARDATEVPDRYANLVVTAPPYPNNYDYADATRLEMSFLGEIQGWGDLQEAVRQYLVRSCSQHVPQKAIDLEEVLSRSELQPIHDELAKACGELAEI